MITGLYSSGLPLTRSLVSIIFSCNCGLHAAPLFGRYFVLQNKKVLYDLTGLGGIQPFPSVAT
jgi:hypothetical protein